MGDLLGSTLGGAVPLVVLAVWAAWAGALRVVATPIVMRAYGGGEEARVAKVLTVTGYSQAYEAYEAYEAAVGRHLGNILARPDLPPADGTRRRVLAVLTYLRA